MGLGGGSNGSNGNNSNNNKDDAKNDDNEEIVGSSRLTNEDDANVRVTRKGRHLARQGQASTATLPQAKSSDSTRATAPNTTFFQHLVVNQPGRPEGADYWQLRERNARQERLESYRREAALYRAQDDETDADSPNLVEVWTPPQVTGELVDSLPENVNDTENKKKRRRRICGAILVVVVCLVVSILAVSLPLTLVEHSKNDPENQEPLPVPTGTPILRRTFAPSVTPGATSFVQFYRDIEILNRPGLLGYSVAFVGERWVAVGVPHSWDVDVDEAAGFVFIFDLYNDIFDRLKSSVTLGEAMSGTKDFLAVATSKTMWLLRSSEVTPRWELVGPDLKSQNLNPIDDPLETVDWEIQALSMDQLSLSANRTLIRLAVTMFASAVHTTFVVVFTIDVSRSQPVWTKKGNTIVVERPLTAEAASVGDNGVVVGSAGQSGAVTQAFLLQGDEWVEQSQFAESFLLGSRLLSVNFHTTNSTVVAHANAPDSSGLGRITVVEVGHDLSVAPKGSPITYLGETTSEWAKTKVVVNGEWLAWGSSYLGEFVGGVYRFEGGEWIKQGSDLRLGVPFGNISLAMSGSFLHEGVRSPTVAVGFPSAGTDLDFVRLFRARG